MYEVLTTFILNHTPLLYWTQSLWRDEAFSVWIAQDSISEVIRRTSGDFNPPLYYILLHYWMKVFGSSEIALRSLSLVAFLLFLIVVYKFAQSIFKNQKWSIYTTLLALVNPMLLYYAFELRMYALLSLWVVLSCYFFYNKKWFWYVLTSALGMYTQPFMAFVILSQFFYLFVFKRYVRIGKNALGIGLLYLPWIPTLIAQFKTSGPMWMWPVDINLVAAVVGNLYVGYEGTPGFLWTAMHFLSVCLIIIFFITLKNKKTKEAATLFLSLVFVPLLVVLGISVVKPIYVNRYLIYSTIGEVFLLSLFVYTIKNKIKAAIVGTVILIATLLFNIYYAPYHQKVNLQKTFATIIPLLTPDDVVHAASPLVYYETLYYTPKNTQVFLYNPDKITQPRYVGSIGMPESTWATVYPSFPKRAFAVKEDGTFTIYSLNPNSL